MKKYFNDEKTILIRSYPHTRMLRTKEKISDENNVSLITSLEVMDKIMKEPWYIDFVPIYSCLIKRNILKREASVDIVKGSEK